MNRWQAHSNMTQENLNDVRNARPVTPKEQPIQDWLVGRVLGKYELIKPIGFGSFASIYEAVHIHLRVPFAIKVLHPAFINHEEVVKRFFREGQAASQLQHENVVFIADFDVEEDVGPYIVMEYLEGKTLKDHIAQQGALSIEETGELARQICQALALAHSKGIIHRDLKPENIFLVPRGPGRSLVKILDFGIAHLADCGESITGAKLLGTPVYMAPEQFRGDTHSCSLDIYSFGILLYEMLTGEPPFKGKNVQQLGIEHLLIPAPALADTFPSELRRIQAQLLAKKPEERPASMEEVWSKLAPAIDPDHAFTHWHQEAIDPSVAEKILQSSKSKKAPTTDTVIEALDEYDFQEGVPGQAADTAKERTPSLSPERTLSNSTPQYTEPDQTLQPDAAPSVSPTQKNPAARFKVKGPADTADESLLLAEVEAKVEAEEAQEKLEPLPPLEPVDTTIMPLNKDGTPKGLQEQFKSLSSPQTPSQPLGQSTAPPLQTVGTGYGHHAAPHPVMPFPANPSQTPPLGHSGVATPHTSSRGVAMSHPPSTHFFGRMGSKEKQLLIVVWLGVLIVVISVFSLIFKTVKPDPKSANPALMHRDPVVKRAVQNVSPSAPSLEQKIWIKTKPSGAQIILDGHSIGTTPHHIVRPFGSKMRIQLRLKGYTSHTYTHQVKSFDTHTLNHTFSTKK